MARVVGAPRGSRLGPVLLPIRAGGGVESREKSRERSYFWMMRTWEKRGIIKTARMGRPVNY